MIIQQKIVALEAVTENKANFRLFGNAALFQNVGTSDVVIDNSMTIPPGESRSFNTDTPDVLIAQNINIMFGAGINRLEIIVMVTANNPQLDNYVKDMQIR